MRKPQPCASKGSQKWLQILVNRHPDLFNQEIAERVGVTPQQIHWLSPLKEDEYAEYSDDAFIDLLQAKLDKVSRKSFWPNRGPVWDGLGRTDNGGLLLVESKAHVPELISGPTGATSEQSILDIDSSLGATKQYLGVKPKVDWEGCFYQYANRLAHLYFLRVLNDLPAFLILLYFVNAEDVDGPKTKAEWEAAILLQESLLGVRNHKLSEYVIHAFIDTRQLSPCTK